MAATAEHIPTQVRGVPPEHVVAIWPRVVPILERVVLPETGYALDHVLTQCQLGHWQLVVVGDFSGVGVISLNERPLGRVLWVWYLAGENMLDWFDDWVGWLDEAGEKLGCVAIEFQSSRKAWAKIQKFAPEYETEFAIWRKRLG